MKNAVKDSMLELGFSKKEERQANSRLELGKKGIKSLLLGLTVPDDRFTFIKDLGVVTVPEGFVPAECLSSFKERNYHEFRHYKSEMTDVRFSNPSHILIQGQQFWARIYAQITTENMTSNDRLKFLAKFHDVFYLGAQGVTLIFDQKRDELPQGYHYYSFDKKENLGKDENGNLVVPGVSSDRVGFRFDDILFKAPLHRGHRFFVFSKVPDNYVEY